MRTLPNGNIELSASELRILSGGLLNFLDVNRRDMLPKGGERGVATEFSARVGCSEAEVWSLKDQIHEILQYDYWRTENPHYPKGSVIIFGA